MNQHSDDEQVLETREPHTVVEQLPITYISSILDRFVLVIGQSVSWLWLVVLAAIVINVIWRYALHHNLGQLEEFQWHVYSVAFLFGLSYCVATDQHIRIDFLQARFSPKLKAWIEFLGILVFAFPFIFLVFRYAIPFAVAAYEIGEKSEQPSGLPYRWIIKSVLCLSFGLLFVAMFSRLSRVTCFLFGYPKPLPKD